MTDPAYLRLDLSPTASPFTVLRAAVRALHPDTRAVRIEALVDPHLASPVVEVS